MTQISQHLSSKDIYARIDQCMLMHRHAFRRKLQALGRTHEQNQDDEHALALLQERIDRSISLVERRKSSSPKVSYNEQLPIADRRAEIAKTIDSNQVVILAGETGSGKTTQLPKICLGLGRGIYGQIAHTQPRRIAARTVASRIAEELDVELGAAVGYQVRFTDQVVDTTLIKLMTDGILLADIQSDPYLNKYDTIILDEAHERSLNIDFLLGYIKQLLPKRPDLKVIVTSATIDLEKFSEHFNSAPIIEVSGRTYPVELRYRPWLDDADDISDAIIGVLEDIQQEQHGTGGDVLVFLSGEREIRDVAHTIKKANLRDLDVLPLYARLSVADQQRVFQSHRGRRVVLSTNVAETSITVPGIRYVIDPGRARISRYSLRTKVQRLPIEAVSQASANQRMGRCGRVSDGVCYRLYSEEDFNSRPAFTDAELLRTNLAAVVLKMLHMRIGSIEDFPFVDVPDSRLIADGYKLLEELQAVDSKGKITTLGKNLSKLSLDPRLARMLVEAGTLGCVDEISIIVAALTIQDPRERPPEKQQAADEKHRRFWHEQSDFLAYVNLWNYIEERRQELTQNQFRKLCKSEYLNYLRLKEWRELHHQLKLQMKDIGLSRNSGTAGFELVHRALLVGLLSNVGKKSDEEKSRDYLGTRSRKFMIFPGSSLRKKSMPWMLAADFIETSQLYAHCIAKIDPAWILDVADHLVKKNYFEPHYDVKSGSVKAFVKISLWGLILAEKKRVDFSKIDPVQARQVFIRSALVEGRYRGKGSFFKKNKKLIDDVIHLEAKARRRDILVDDEQIFIFYEERIPSNVVNLSGFDYWRENSEKTNPQLLLLTRDSLMLHSAQQITEEQFPNQIKNGDLVFPVRYIFEPTGNNDGLNIYVPVDLLHQVKALQLDWLVPGLIREKCISLVKSLPKQKRKNLVPVPDYVDKVLGRLSVTSGELTESLAVALGRVANIEILETDWHLDKLDSFYFANIVLIDDANRVVDQGRDLSALREKYRDQVQATLQNIGSDIERSGLTRWDFEVLPAAVDLKRGRVTVKAYPALVGEEKARTADIKLFDNPREAAVSHFHGLCLLALNETGQTAKYARKQLLAGNDIGLTLVNLGGREQVANDMLLASVRRACFDGELTANDLDKSTFFARVNGGKAEIVVMASEYEAVLLQCCKLVLEIKKQVKYSKNALAMALTFGDVQRQIDQIFQPHVLFNTPWRWVEQFPRYLDAALVRLQKAAQKPQADRTGMSILDDAWRKHEDRYARLGQAEYLLSEQWQDYRWMLEELRVSLFAQSLKTLVPVSEKRLKKHWDSLP